MKKILVLLLAIAGTYEAKAQQATPKTVNPLLFNKLKSADVYQFKAADSTLYRSLLTPLKTNPLAALQQVKGDEKYTEVFYNRMPVVKPTNNEKMPVAKATKDDKMPIVKYRSVDPLAVLKSNP